MTSGCLKNNVNFELCNGSKKNFELCRRREGYEFMIGPPKVINKTVDGKLLEPYEVSLYFVYIEWKYSYLLIY